MKKVSLIILSFLCLLSAYSTHNRAGEKIEVNPYIQGFDVSAKCIVVNEQIIFKPNINYDRELADFTWFWDFGDGTTSNQQNPSHTFSDYGYHCISLTVTITLCPFFLSNSIG